MNGLTQDGTAEPVSRDLFLLRREWGQGKKHFPCSEHHDDQDHEQDSIVRYSIQYTGDAALGHALR